MENRGGSFPAGLAVVAGLLFTVGTTIAAVPAGVPHVPHRTVAVTILADSALRKNEIWKIDISRAMTDVNMELTDVSGIVLKIIAFDYWTPNPIAAGVEGSPGPKAIAEVLSLMNSRIREEGRGGSEIVIGLVPEGPEGPVFLGIADYLMGTIVIKNLKSKGVTPYVLLHEVCHLFGAVDLRTNGSVMSLRSGRFRIDAFTKAIIRANRQRSFLVEGFPLSEDRVPEAINIYEGRQALGLEEEELAICLAKLKEARSGHLPSPR